MSLLSVASAAVQSVGGWEVVSSLVASFLSTAAVLLAATRSARLRAPKAPLEPKEARRKAKLENERLKLMATLFNGTAIAVFLGTGILPIFKAYSLNPEPLAVPQTLVGFVLASMLHLLGLGVLGFWRSEE